MKIDGLPVVYPFKPYQQVRRGLFSIECESREYDIKTGWKQKLVERDIVGENDFWFIDELKVTTSRFNGKGRKEILAMGIHKTRLVKWLNGQLSMF